jgi:peptidoglycan hydrolase FlgJ
MKIPSVQPAGSLSDHSSHARLRELTQEFESLFVSQVMQSMRRTVPESRLIDHNSGQHLFQDMLDQELSRRIADAGGFGLGEILYRQLADQPSVARPAEGSQDNES